MRERQERIAAMMCLGMRRSEIARRLDLSENSYDYARKQLYDSFGVTSEAQIGVIAVLKGWLTAEQCNHIVDHANDRIDVRRTSNGKTLDQFLGDA
jgi:DNA-binding CsgD family transcriptional regulator